MERPRSRPSRRGFRFGWTSLVRGACDEFGIALRLALERQEIVVAAAPIAGIAAAGSGAGRVDGAAPLVGVEEPADAAEVLILLAAHGVLVAPALHCELGLGFVEGQVEVPCESLDVPLGEGD